MSYIADPEDSDRMARSAFGDVYPAIARQILDNVSVSMGICLDIGAGPASLAIAISEISDLDIYALDISREMNLVAKKNVEDKAMSDKIVQITGDVQCLPFKSRTIDLVVSRGSVFYWNDRVNDFKEIYRILRPGGHAYIGGGLGYQRPVRQKTGVTYIDIPSKNNFRRNMLSAGELRASIADAYITDYTVIDDESGLWAIWKK